MTNCTSCLKKKTKNYYLSVKPQKIITELNNGKLLDGDYYGRSFDLLSGIDTTTPTRVAGEAQNTFHIYELHKILDPCHNSLEQGFTRMSDGTWYLASKKVLEGVRGEQVEWWFNHCDSTERFKWWHPTNNVHGEYDPTFYSVQPEDRLVGHNVGHRFTCIKKMYSGGCEGGGVEVMQHIDYLNPEEFINTSALAAAGITACIIGRITYRDHHLGAISVGHLCHTVTERLGVVTMVSRMWLGEVVKTDLNFPSPAFVNIVGNTLLYRYLKFSRYFVKDVWAGMVQEMGCLAGFLSDFYQEELKELAVRKERAMSEVMVTVTRREYEEYSEGGYEEESMSEEEDNGKKLSTTNDFAEESMSESEEEEVGVDLQLTSSSTFGRGNDFSEAVLGGGDHYYEYDSEEEGQAEGRQREIAKKRQEESKHSALPSSSRVGKGIGV